MPETEVVILNWNGLQFLQQFLPVLISQTPAEKARIVVADNGSTDGSLDWLARVYPETVTTIAFDHNYGFAEGYNKAIEHCKGRYALLLNSDVEVSPGWLDPLIKAIQPVQVAAVMPVIRSFHNKDNFEYAGAAGGFIDRWGFPFCRGRILGLVEKDTGQYDDLTEVFWATGACMMIKVDIFRKAGGFDANFFAHMEEIDLCWRIKLDGYSILAVPESKVYHVGGGTLPSGNYKKVYLNVRNSLLTLYKNLPSSSVATILAVRMILDGVAAFKFLFEGKSRNFTAVLKAHLSFYRERKNYRAHRRYNNKITFPNSLSGYYPRSILIDYYIRRKRVFSAIKSKIRNQSFHPHSP